MSEETSPQDLTMDDVQTGEGQELPAGAAEMFNKATEAAKQANPDWLKSIGLEDKSGLEKFQSVDDLAKSYKELESKLGAPAEKIESPDAYKYETPENIKFDPEVDGQFRALAHELGITQKQFEGLQDFASELASNAQEASMPEGTEEAYAYAEKELKSAWGDEMESNLHNARKAVIKMVGEDGIDWAESNGLANDPKFLQLMAKVGAMTGEDSLHMGRPSMGKEAAQMKIAEIMGNTSHAYHDDMHPGHKSAVDEVAKYYEMVYGS